MVGVGVLTVEATPGSRAAGADFCSTDERVMLRWATGDLTAYRHLFDRHGGRVLRFLERRVGGPRAQALLAEVFLQVHRARREFRKTMQFRTWLFTIAWNVRREYASTGGISDAPGWSSLPQPERDIFELHALEGLPLDEVAAVLGLSEHRVAVLAGRAAEYPAPPGGTG